MSSKSNVIRWLLIVPTAIVVWYSCLILGFVSLHLLNYFCAPELMNSGYCSAKWYGVAEDIFIALFASLSAIFIVTSSVLLAPNKKSIVAIISFAVGFIIACYMAYHTKAWLVLAAVSFAGAITTTFFVLKLKNNAP